MNNFESLDVEISQVKLPILALLRIKLKIGDERPSCEDNLSDENHSAKRRTLMDVVRSESFQPKLNFPEKSDLINSFLPTGNVDIISSLFVSPTNGKSLNGKSLMFDAVMHQAKTVLKGVLYQNKGDFQRLLVSIQELLWYFGPQKASLKVEIAQYQSFLNVWDLL